ncbi:MAG: carboxypeptidase regulatory-like domain-containing protein, partial [Gemmatimonadota bacterium]|nr:carboxypeptidase regulatory-like domain-containing protein [Gemmatimonadota bacterium]
MMILRWIRRVGVAILPLLAAAPTTSAQGITTAAISGRVTDESGNPRPDARVVAVHQPSGTTYEGRTRQDGRVTIPGMRVGGPYRVTATMLGFEPSVRDSVFLALGVAADLQFVMRSAAVRLAQVTVTAESETVFSSERTGAATSVGREAIATMPTITARIEDFARLTPQYSGSGFGFSFAGQDNRLNNVTIDGSYFNNSFGLAGQPGDRTGVAPISMDAIEQLQVNIAPYDVRQGNFVGAGVNTVTRSGTNDFTGSAYYAFRDNRPQLHGDRAKGLPVNPGEFEFSKLGISVGGPILRDKLFYFVNYENDATIQPGTTFRANPGGAQVIGNMTRVLESDLTQLSEYLRTNFNYETGPFQGYDHETPALRFLAKLDYNLGTRHKLSFRYSHLDSDTDVLLSNSGSLGFGSRRTSTTGLNFQNSNYKILENIRSGVGEWNAMIGRNMSNNLLVGYSHHDESRGFRGTMFPFVDILQNNLVYTSFGFEPFTPSNELRYGSTQVQNNFSIYGNKHELTFGVSAEWYNSENVFFPGSQSVYVYN